MSEDAQYCPNCGTLIGKPEQSSAPSTPEFAKASATRSFFGRIYGAMLLHTSVYEEVEADQTATTQASLVVLLGSVSQGIGRALSHGLRGFGPMRAGVGFLEGLVSALLLWLVWSFITYFVGTRVFGGRATYGELLRTIGFANSPNLLAVFTFIPLLGGLLWIWALIAMIVAVRQALDFSTGQAIMTCVVGFIAAIVLFLVAALLLAIPIALFNLL